MRLAIARRNTANPMCRMLAGAMWGGERVAEVEDTCSHAL